MAVPSDQPLQVSIDDFLRLQIRVGRIVKAEIFPKARKPAYKLWIDFGELGIKQSSAQITALYSVDELHKKLVVAVVNFPPLRVADFTSQVLVLGVPTGDDEVALLQPDRDVPLGLRVL